MICSCEGKHPVCAPTARVAENATLAGDVTVAEKVSIWYGAVLRGDAGPIRVGEGSNIQDNVVVHCDTGTFTSVGRWVTVGHGAIVHGCTVEDEALIGMGAILLNGSVIGRGSLVAAGALVPEGAVIPPDSLAVGSPARVVRTLRPEEREELRESARNYWVRAEQQLPAAPTGKEAAL